MVVAALAGLDPRKDDIVSDKTDDSAKTEGKKARSKGAELVPVSKGTDVSPPEGVRALAMEYPFAMLAGGIVAGMVIGALLPRANTGRLARNVGALASVVGELGLAYARKAVDGVSDVAENAAEAGGKVAEAAGETVQTYSGKAAETAEHAVANLRQSAEGLARQVIRLTSHLRH